MIRKSFNGGDDSAWENHVIANLYKLSDESLQLMLDDGVLTYTCFWSEKVIKAAEEAMSDRIDEVLLLNS